MGVEFKIVENNVEAAKQALADATDRALEAIGIQASSFAKTELTNDPVRVDTGRLRNSITHAVKDDAVYVGTNVEYAIYVHEGTQKMAANRFLKNAVVRNQKTYKAIAENEFKKTSI